MVPDRRERRARLRLAWGKGLQVEAFRRFAKVEDPLADAIVAMFGQLPTGQGRRMFEQALEQGVDTVDDPPQALLDFFAQIDAVPFWLDRDQLARGARTLRRCGLHSAVMAMLMALYGGYLASRPDKVLVATGDLDYAAARRLARPPAGRSTWSPPPAWTGSASASGASCGCGSCTRWFAPA